jgi:hypothetical protein
MTKTKYKNDECYVKYYDSDHKDLNYETVGKAGRGAYG